MSQRCAEIVASRFQQWNLVAPDFKVTAFRGRKNKESIDKCFAIHEPSNLTYCTDVNALFQALDTVHESNAWRLFIDSSVRSIKAVLLHIGNEKPSVPIAYGTNIKETNESIALILKLINYDLYGWRLCCDLKMVAILTGIKQGFSKYQCFLCLWEGRDKKLHYTDHQWPRRVDFRLGKHCVDHDPLVPSDKIILPPLHIKLGLIKNFVRALNQEGEAFEYLKTIFKNLSSAKIKAGKLT